MCGIVGYTGDSEALPVLIDSLHRLEYRGYDSAGVAIQQNGEIEMDKIKGKIDDLEASLDQSQYAGTCGIGHTRWATHGIPSTENAHPHFSDDEKIMIVHNGIIENYRQLRADLAENPTFTSETDTEVLAHLLSELYDGDLTEAMRSVMKQVEGSLAVVALHADEQGKIVAARSGSSLIVGQGEDGMYTASDLPALLDYTREVIFLDQDEIATLTSEDVTVTTLSGEVRNKAVNEINWDAVRSEKGGYKHFMSKEIAEQPDVMNDAMRERISENASVQLPQLELNPDELANLRKISLIACGTSYHACMVAKYWLEEFTTLQIDVDIASEYRYRTLHPGDRELLVAVSQSGETADTLSALHRANESGLTTLAVVNVLGSTMTREADGVLYTHAGPEIGVASTKSFMTQLVVLFLFSVYLGQFHDEKRSFSSLLEELLILPEKVEWQINQRNLYKDIAEDQFKKEDFLYLGRHLNYPLALEGALKLKEISYIHAEGYPAGEMKHGPIALIDEEMPVVALSPNSRVYEKIVNNIEETRTRDGLVISVGKQEDKDLAEASDYYIPVPETKEVLTPLIMTVPMQILAYEIAVLRGCDVDQPRNLAKSVTVE